MELQTKYYRDIFEQFLEQCPMWADDVIEYRPKNMYAIRITMRTGKQIDYNVRSGSYRFVTNLDVVANDDITDDGFRSIFATNLSEIMRIKGFGQAELAERTGLSSAMISKYLNQKATPSMTNLLKIARALNCHPDELYE